MSLPVVRTVADLRAAIGKMRMARKRVALVPTMGALHAGHLSLVARGLELADCVVATIFVNPTQFGPNEDFERYPRQEAEDRAKLEKAGAHLLFAPGSEEMYPEGFATTVSVSGVSEGLCGGARPGHFDGVAAVVAKLLLQAMPDVAVFGEKDYQQLAVIRRLTADLNIPVRIEGAPTVREADGLALSSRNQYLSEAERAVAPALHGAISRVLSEVTSGEEASDCCRKAIEGLLAAGFDTVDYLEVRDASTLKPVTDASRPIRVLAAARLGKTRLIDNV